MALKGPSCEQLALVTSLGTLITSSRTKLEPSQRSLVSFFCSPRSRPPLSSIHVESPLPSLQSVMSFHHCSVGGRVFSTDNDQDTRTMRQIVEKVTWPPCKQIPALSLSLAHSFCLVSQAHLGHELNVALYELVMCCVVNHSISVLPFVPPLICDLLG